MAIKQKRKRTPESYRKRTYRRTIDSTGLQSFKVKVRETDLHLLSTADFSAETHQLVVQYRNHLETYLAGHSTFLTSLVPLEPDPLAPLIVKEMMRAAVIAGVGPMATVAGAIAEFVGKDLISGGAREIIVENGGDIFMKRKQDCRVGIFAGSSPLSNRIGLVISKEMMPLGVCTSSGTVGHSLSLGKADSVTVLSPSACLADGVATRLGNEIKESRDMNHALALAQSIPDIIGVVAVSGKQVGAWGQVELVSLE